MLSAELLINKHSSLIDDYLISNPNSLIYHNSNYINLISRHLGANWYWLIAKRQNSIVGVLPFLSKEGPIGEIYNSLAYYGSNGGIIDNSDDDVKKFLLNEYYTVALKRKIACMSLITNPLLGDYKFYEENASFNYKDNRIGQITTLELNSGVNDIMEVFDNPRPRNIRRAIKEGVKVERTQSQDAINFLYNTHKVEMEAKGGSAKKYEFFKLISSNLRQNQWNIYIAKLGDKPIAALLLLYFNRTVEYFTPAIIYQYRNTQASTLIIYEAMKDAINNGFSNWNWGGTWSSQKGVYDFKKKWNAKNFPYFYYIKLFNSDLLDKSTEYLQKNYYGFYTVPFSKLNNN